MITDDGPATNCHPLNYTVTVANAGASDAANASAAIKLDSSLTYSSSSASPGSGWTFSFDAASRVVTAQTPSFAAGSSFTGTISVTTGGSATMVNTDVTATASNASSQMASDATAISVPASCDAASLKYVPASTAEWSALVGPSFGPPTNVWLLQDVTGSTSLKDAVGSLPLVVPLTASCTGLPIYQQIVSGWDRVAVGVPLSQISCWGTTSAPDLSTTSIAILAYVAVAVPQGGVDLFALGGGSHALTSVNANRDVLLTTPTTSSAPGNSSLGDMVHPILTKVDRAHQVYRTYTDSEIIPITAAWDGGVNGTVVAFGTYYHGSPPASYLYVAMWTGPVAEQLDDNTVRTMLQKLNWTVAW